MQQHMQVVSQNEDVTFVHRDVLTNQNEEPKIYMFPQTSKQSLSKMGKKE